MFIIVYPCFQETCVGSFMILRWQPVSTRTTRKNPRHLSPLPRDKTYSKHVDFGFKFQQHKTIDIKSKSTLKWESQIWHAKKQKHGSSYFHHIFRMKTARMIGFYMLRPPFWTTVILDPHKSHTWNLGYLPTRDHELSQLSGALWKKHCCGSLPHKRSPEARATGGLCLFCHPGHPKWEWFGTIPLLSVALFRGNTLTKNFLCSGRLARNMWHHMVNPILKFTSATSSLHQVLMVYNWASTLLPPISNPDTNHAHEHTTLMCSIFSAKSFSAKSFSAKRQDSYLFVCLSNTAMPCIQYK